MDALLAGLLHHTPPPKPLLTLYNYEALPWCRLVHKYATILGLAVRVRPCPWQTLFLEGAFDVSSRLRPEAMTYLKTCRDTDELTFPLLVDKTDAVGMTDPTVVHQSYDILLHLWERYGQDVLGDDGPWPDQLWNSNWIPFPLRFLSLAAPSYLRAWPTCGILQSPSLWTDRGNVELVLHQAKGCPKSRLVWEALCTLEIPYLSVPAPHLGGGAIPVLINGNDVLHDADACVKHLWTSYHDPTRPPPTWWSGMPLRENIARKGGSFSVGAFAAYRCRSQAFVPKLALQ